MKSISPAKIAIKEVCQSHDIGVGNIFNSPSGELLEQPFMPDNPILVSKREFLEQVLQKSHTSSFASIEDKYESQTS